jgi:alkylhydroperoxidase family enzyme
MAYLDLSSPDAVIGSRLTVSSGSQHRRLNALERAAVLLARSDRASNLAGTGYLSKIAEMLFGLRRPNKLADLRLEALRRFAVAVARGRTRLAQWEQAELQAYHFTDFQIEEAFEIASRFGNTRRGAATSSRAMAA